MHFSRYSRAGALVLVLAAGSSNLFADGRIQGRIVDASGKVYFEGAILSIKELNLEVTSGNGGQYSFPQIPAGEYSLQVDYIGAKTVTTQVSVVDNRITRTDISIGEEVGAIDNVIVYGQAAGASSALNRQRAADNLKSVVSADAIGQFPDANVSEALQRVPGVFIERDQGEGRFVGIRGLSPNLNSATINGVNIPAPESDRRSVAFDVIPSDLLEGLEVTKSVTSDMDGDAIGGNIEIKSLSAFDRDAMTYQLSAEGNYNELQEEYSPKFNGTFTNVMDTGAGELGIALSASWQERKFGSENVETDGNWEPDLEDSGFRGAEEIEMRDYSIERKRLGLALNLDFRPNENSTYYLRSLYSHFEDQEYRQRIELKLADGDLESIDANSARWTDLEVERSLKDRFEEQKILSIVLGGENQWDDWLFEYSLGVSSSEENEPNRRDTTFANDNDIAFAGYNSIGEKPGLFYSDDALDPANFALDELVIENNLTEDEQVSFRFDLTRDLNFGQHPGNLKFGVKVSSREKTDDVNASVYDGFSNDPLLADFAAASPDFGLYNFGPAINLGALNRYFDTNLSDFELDSDETALSSARDYVMNEDISAAYIMSRVDINDLRLVYGVRYEYSEFEAKGFNVIEANGDVIVEPNRFNDDYSHFLPSLNLRYRATEDLILRAAFTQTISRASFGDLTPSAAAIEIDEEDLEIEAGNPLLQPYEANNFDLAVEYYPGTIGVLSAGVFYKQIDHFIFTADVSGQIDLTPFVGNLDLSEVTDFEVIQAQNGNDAELWGLELSWTKHFSNLPKPWNGLLLIANATFTDSEANLALGDNPDRSANITLPGQSDEVGNLVLGYESGPLSLRISAAYTGRRLLEVDLSESSGDRYQDDHLQIDVSARYDLNDRIQVFFNAINLTDEPFYAYFGSRAYSSQYEEYGPSYVLGIKFRNF